MTIRRVLPILALTGLAGCIGPEGTAQLDAEAEAFGQRIAEAQEERKAHGRGSVVYDLISLRIAIHEQTLAMLEQRRAAGSWRTKLAYTLDGKAYVPPADRAAKAPEMEARLKHASAGREYDLKAASESDGAFKPLHLMSAATRSVLISQLEYQLAAHRHGFPPYYVPFHPPAEGVTSPQLIEIPAGKSAVVQ